MKKVLLGSCLFGILLVGCGDVAEEAQSVNNRFQGLKGDVNVIKDITTGCNYIYIDKGALDQRVIALSPLYKSDGTVDCNSK